MDTDEARSTYVGIVGLDRVWMAYLTHLRVYDWGVRVGPRTKAAAWLGFLPRWGFRWDDMYDVRCSGRTVRFPRHEHADITFRSWKPLGDLVDALSAHGVEVQPLTAS